MTKWQEFPLRQHLKPWPGLNTRGGKLMSIGGEMDDCTNVIINRQDVLEKRKGLVRGLDEQFGGVVCGLFVYTDHCGIEKLIVADEDGFSIRSPFTVPIFATADCYPFDSFGLDDLEGLNSDNWRNTSRYEHFSDRMVLQSSVVAGAQFEDAPGRATRWFKDACSRSYVLSSTYQFDSSSTSTQVFFIVMRGNGDLSSSSLLLAEIRFKVGGDYRLKIYDRDSFDAWTLQGQAQIVGTESGTFQLEYDQQTRIGKATVNPIGGTLVTASTQEFAVTADADFGLTSAFGIAFDSDGSVPDTDLGYLVVDGGPV